MVWRRINKCFAVSEWERENEWKQTFTPACSFKWLFSCHPSAGTMCCPPEYHQGTKENSIKHFYILIGFDCYRYLQQHVGEPRWWVDKSIQQRMSQRPQSPEGQGRHQVPKRERDQRRAFGPFWESTLKSRPLKSPPAQGSSMNLPLLTP